MVDEEHKVRGSDRCEETEERHTLGDRAEQVEQDVTAEDDAAADASRTCMICGRIQTDGLHIVEEFICLDCERELIHTEVSDAKYPFFISRMKQVWQRKNA